jgi:Kef-type K+ transport system membrane component KefB
MADVVPPLAPEPLLRLLLGVAALLLLARLLGRAAERSGLPSIVGDLLTGVLLGPSVLGFLAPGSPTGWRRQCRSRCICWT